MACMDSACPYIEMTSQDYVKRILIDQMKMLITCRTVLHFVYELMHKLRTKVILRVLFFEKFICIFSR